MTYLQGRIQTLIQNAVETGDTRENPAILIARELLEENAEVVITDPQAIEHAKVDLANVIDRVKFEADPYKAAKGAHAVALLTEWKEYKTLDYQKIYDGMVQPAALHKIGFNVHSIGKAALKHI
jgi:UDPglucose 6-dehydrogenase